MNEPSPGGGREVTKTCREILEYLTEHPDAGDTADGILQWWMMERQVMAGKSTIQAAIDLLIKRNWILAALAQDSRRHYRLNHEKASEIRKFLRSKKSP